MELYGHVLGMLDRDQRTVKSVRSSINSCYHHRECGCLKGEFYLLHNGNSENDVSSSRTKTKRDHDLSGVVHGKTSPSTCGVVKRRKVRKAWFGTYNRLHRTLLLGFYLSLVSFPTTTSAAPSSNRKSTMMTDKKVEKWMQPCGTKGSPNVAQKLTETELSLTPIIDQSRRTHQKANEFKELFAKKTFKMNWESFHSMSNYPSFEWLLNNEKIPKNLGEAIPPQHLHNLKLDETLYNSYEYLQRVAVGLDQIVEDETKKSASASLKGNFEELEKYILSVLCEIESTMTEVGLEKRTDITRDILPDNAKNGDNTQMNIRNYVILRDTIIILEYIIECFEHLKQKLN